MSRHLHVTLSDAASAKFECSRWNLDDRDALLAPHTPNLTCNTATTVPVEGVFVTKRKVSKVRFASRSCSACC